MSESSSEAIEVTPEDLEAAKESAEASEASEDTEAAEESRGPFSGKTAWARRMETPLRMFLRTETGSASVLAGATVLALIWANISYLQLRQVLGDPAVRARRQLGRDA